MNEIKVFLVEDEMVIRRGIKNSIDWEKKKGTYSVERQVTENWLIP